jgi:acyl carrier protein
VTSSWLADCGVLYLDHVAVTTPVFERTVGDYLGLPGARLLKGPGNNPTQKVTYAFIQLLGGPIVEVLGLQPDSPIGGHVRQGGGPYHFCYAVADLDASIGRACGAGARVIVPASPDVAFDGRRVAFLFHESQGLFEFVEALPASLNGAASSRAGQAFRPAVDVVQAFSPAEPGSPNRRRPGYDESAEASAKAEGLRYGRKDDVDTRLAQVFQRVFPSLAAADVPRASINDTLGWDSLGHIRLVMELEAEFGIDIPADDIATLTSFERLRQKLVT